MKTRIAILFLAAVALLAADLPLIPYPQSVEVAGGELAVSAPFTISVLSKTQGDRFSATMLQEEFYNTAGLRATVSTIPRAGHGVVIGYADNEVVARQISKRGLDAGTLSKPESYLLRVDENGALITSRTPAGLFYGVQTLRQLIRPAGKRGHATIPYVKIADWPALRYRGLSIDVSRGPILNEEQMRTAIRTLAEYKLNMASFYMEHVFPFTHSPGVAPEGAELSPDLIKRLVEYARDFHIEIVPQQQTFGHLHHMLKFELYSPMAELPYGHVLAAEDQNAFTWVEQAAKQLAEAFPSTFIHIGSDETWELGQGRSKEYAARAGIGEGYMERIRRVIEMLKPLKRRPMFWGDIALNHPELIQKLPKELVAMTWGYSPREDFSNQILPFRNAGMDFFVCPGVNNWNRMFPNFDDAVGNINNFVRDGKKHGAMGMLNTDWRDDGEALFNMAWYPIVFSAAAAWQPGAVDTAKFDAAFDWAFYRNNGSEFVDSIHNLARIHALFRSTKITDAADGLFWFDPFSRLGANWVPRLLPVASEIRTLAERTAIQLAASSAKARLHPRTVDYLRFAAWRADTTLMKVELASEIAQRYREAMATPKRAVSLLGSMSSPNGLVQDIRDAMVQRKAEYRRLWLDENRPYFLDSMLARYDHEILYWTAKERLFIQLRNEFSLTKSLPSPEQIGLVLP